MNTLVLMGVCSVVLICGYIFYGGWLARQWGVGEGNLETPAHTMADGVDYVPAKAPVLMGHHFSSIAGAGPITGPIGAAMFGWLPVTLWVLIGGIFFGGVHDFGALFASIRHRGKSIGEIISLNMSKRAKQLFIIFSYLTLILVVAAFAAIVASTFGATYKDGVLDAAASATNASVAMVSIMFILLAIVFGFAVYRRHTPMVISSILGVLAIAACMAIGMNFHPFYFSTSTWMILVGIYITIASVTPVWILLQPRDYLSSFLLYAMLIVAFVGIIGVVNGAGRIIWSTVSDWIGRGFTYIMFFAMEIFAFYRLSVTGEKLFFEIIVLLVISCYGGGFSCMPAYLSDIFGVRHLAAIHGTILTAWGIAGIAGPLVLAVMKEMTGGYELTLDLFEGMMVLAFVIATVLYVSNRKGV